MGHFRRTLYALATFIVVVLLLGTAHAQSSPTAITWYAGGAARLRLDPIPAETASSVVLAGTTTQTNLLVTVAKQGGNARSTPLPLAADGSFKVRYLIKDGLGTYTITFSGNEQKGSLKYQGLASLVLAVDSVSPAASLNPELNEKIVEFVDLAFGTTVGRGECWDLAQAALDANLADWIRPTTFGLPLNPETDEIKAGDIIQFRALTITEQVSDNVTRRETLGRPDHTAVIYKVLGNKRYTLAHQNVHGQRNVIKSDIDLTHVTGGQYWVYRPVALMLRQ